MDTEADLSAAPAADMPADVDLAHTLRRQVGTSGPSVTARDPVNQPMIRQWCDAMDDHNPVYTDADEAAVSRFGAVVAPPTMLNAWTMAGLRHTRDPRDPQAGVLQELEAHGFTGVVATNCEQVYHRYLHLGDLLTETKTLVDVSDEKTTAIGTGHFVTTETQYHDQHGDLVGSMSFRILKYQPGTGRTARPAAEAGAGSTSADRPRRPRPARNMTTDGFWDGANGHQLRIQRCSDCGRWQHPPGVRCPACGSAALTWETVSGHGRLYSYAVPHYPKVPAFDYPLVVGLIELAEGPRLVSNVTACTPEQLRIDMPLEVHWLEVEPGVTLPQFRPVRPPRVTTTRTVAEISVGHELPLCPVPLDPTVVIATAIASRDYQQVHHDRDVAQGRGAADIFMNILSSCGITGRWLTDWAGPEARLRSLQVHLGVPNHPYDTMTLSGSVTAVDGPMVTCAFEGRNSLGAHVRGHAQIELV